MILEINTVWKSWLKTSSHSNEASVQCWPWYLETERSWQPASTQMHQKKRERERGDVHCSMKHNQVVQGHLRQLYVGPSFIRKVTCWEEKRKDIWKLSFFAVSWNCLQSFQILSISTNDLHSKTQTIPPGALTFSHVVSISLVLRNIQQSWLKEHVNWNECI